MKRSPLDMAKERLSQYLKSNNLRESDVRNMVVEAVCSLSQPFTAEQLVEACASQQISVGTVYNTLNLLVKAQVLHATERQRGCKAREYELITGSLVRMREICETCGKAIDYHDKATERLILDRKYSNFSMHHFTLFVYGECKRCRDKREKREKKGIKSI